MFKFRVALFPRLWITEPQNALAEADFMLVIHSFNPDTLCAACQAITRYIRCYLKPLGA